MFSSFLLLNIDRSRSVYVLKWVDYSGKSGVSMSDILSKGSGSDMDTFALKQRIDEQIQSGNIQRNSSQTLTTTYQGHLLNQFFRIIARLESLDGYSKS